jgi:transposase
MPVWTRVVVLVVSRHNSHRKTAHSATDDESVCALLFRCHSDGAKTGICRSGDIRKTTSERGWRLSPNFELCQRTLDSRGLVVWVRTGSLAPGHFPPKQRKSGWPRLLWICLTVRGPTGNNRTTSC